MSGDAICPKCRHPLNPAAQFCENCGARAAAGPAGHASANPGRTRVVVAYESPFMTVVSACLFIWVGFFMSWGPPSEHPVFDASVPVWVWGTRSIGIGLLVVAALAYLRVPFVVVLDAIVSVAAALVCLGVGAIWLYFGYRTEGFMIFIFGLFNSRAAWAAVTRVMPGVERG